MTSLTSCTLECAMKPVERKYHCWKTVAAGEEFSRSAQHHFRNRNQNKVPKWLELVRHVLIEHGDERIVQWLSRRLGRRHRVLFLKDRTIVHVIVARQEGSAK